MFQLCGFYCSARSGRCSASIRPGSGQVESDVLLASTISVAGRVKQRYSGSDHEVGPKLVSLCSPPPLPL